jgi:hypothetical protein
VNALSLPMPIWKTIACRILCSRPRKPWLGHNLPAPLVARLVRTLSDEVRSKMQSYTALPELEEALPVGFALNRNNRARAGRIP